MRGSFSLGLVIAGYGLREMALVLLASQSIGYALTYWYCRRIYPELRLSPRLFSLDMARRSGGTGLQNMTDRLAVLGGSLNYLRCDTAGARNTDTAPAVARP